MRDQLALTSGGAMPASSRSRAPHRNYRVARRPAHSAWVEPEQWLRQTPQHEGSWWPAWRYWLHVRTARARQADSAAAAWLSPGQYVMQRYSD
jgi:polyhydroxyalkanoate synthase